LDYIQQSKKWIREFVIKYDLCPFALSVYNDDKILYSLEPSDDLKSQLIAFWNICHSLNTNDNYSTAFLILPFGIDDFEKFLDLFDRANLLLEETDLASTIQLAGFHPEYLFEDSDKHDCANYTNRSPYPMIHVLLVDDVHRAVKSYLDVELIPERNILKLRELGLDSIRKILENIKSDR